MEDNNNFNLISKHTTLNLILLKVQNHHKITNNHLLMDFK